MSHAFYRARAHVRDAKDAFRSGRPMDGFAELAQLRTLLADSDAPYTRPLLLQADALEAWNRGEIDRGLSTQDELITLLTAEGQSAALAEALIDDAEVRMMATRPQVQERLHAGLEVARATGDLTLQAQASCTQAVASLRQNQPGEAIVAGLAAAAAGRRVGAPQWVCTAEGTAAAALAQLGDPLNAQRLVAKALTLAQSSGLPMVAANLRLELVMLLAKTGSLAEAEVELLLASSELEAPPPRVLAKQAFAQAVVARAWGQIRSAQVHAATARDRWTTYEDHLQAATAHALLVELAVESRATEEAQALLDDPRLQPAPPAVRSLTRARAAVLLDSVSAAAFLARNAAEVAREHGATGLQDDALQLCVAAHIEAGNTDEALHAAIALAELRAFANSRVQELHATASDARRRVHEEAERVQRSLQAAESPRLLGVLERMNHAARNGLAMASTSAELLAEPEPPQPRARLLEQLMAAVTRVERHLDEALEQVRSFDTATGPTALGPLLRGLAAQLEGPCAQHQVLLRLHIEGSAATSAPAALVAEMVYEVLITCVRHGSPGRALEVRLSSDAHAAVVTVVDAGPGLSELGDPLTPSIVRRSAERCGGRLILDSSPEGSQAQLVLPLA